MCDQTTSFSYCHVSLLETCVTWNGGFPTMNCTSTRFNDVIFCSMIQHNIKRLIWDYWCLQTPVSMYVTSQCHNVPSWHDNCNLLRFSLRKFSISENRPVDHIGVLQTPIITNITNGTRLVCTHVHVFVFTIEMFVYETKDNFVVMLQVLFINALLLQINCFISAWLHKVLGASCGNHA